MIRTLCVFIELVMYGVVKFYLGIGGNYLFRMQRVKFTFGCPSVSVLI